jgi:hypothetical protein
VNKGSLRIRIDPLLFAAAFFLSCMAKLAPLRPTAARMIITFNSSGHVVHSPSCGEEYEKGMAECRDGSVS